MGVDALIVPVILSGGAGTRLWPMSRPDTPKQMLALTGEHTMLQMTADRVRFGKRYAAPIVVASARHADAIDAQLAGIGIDNACLVLEPAARNTAPAIALAALAAGGGDAPLLVMPSDHVIADQPAFQRAVDLALPLVRDGWLVTFGIAPDAPETGYGYLHIGEQVADGAHKVARFVEKPPRAAAEAMIASGDHAWNGGIFLFRADAFLNALGEHAPDILAAATAATNGATRENRHILPDPAAFAASPSESIDYAVMEKATRVAVVPVSMGWSDVGSWDALHAISKHDDGGNALSGDVTAIDSTNCLVRTDHARIAMVGVSDLIVVANGNDILILPRGRSQEVKRIIAELDDGGG
ncbi:mannose-1-phosphate guanylyltransferase/mannose-6-phosphate isomerase [Sphingomonas sp. AX6]|uniref:mannose-1-phosphate guanylyltransferase/mannose-6-phosphate isomerase n=1 Tax=Sphingomonas sp. AX6 TaxID=2653171 RepID=UPI0012F3478E|nr:mannose-1-phosphate guanylyltransferase/mannose-6-phosphate isomerase [Sphingomonas sp. AX6]VXC52455.1 Mannose-1-phosphate guanylyltransferase (GDP) [Sphingomonas sp. AX6]